MRSDFIRQPFFFEKESADDLKPYGLDRPKARITLSDGKKSEVIILGGHIKDEIKEKE